MAKIGKSKRMGVKTFRDYFKNFWKEKLDMMILGLAYSILPNNRRGDTKKNNLISHKHKEFLLREIVCSSREGQGEPEFSERKTLSFLVSLNS